MFGREFEDGLVVKEQPEWTGMELIWKCRSLRLLVLLVQMTGLQSRSSQSLLERGAQWLIVCCDGVIVIFCNIVWDCCRLFPNSFMTLFNWQTCVGVVLCYRFSLPLFHTPGKHRIESQSIHKILKSPRNKFMRFSQKYHSPLRLKVPSTVIRRVRVFAYTRVCKLNFFFPLISLVIDFFGS